MSDDRCGKFGGGKLEDGIWMSDDRCRVSDVGSLEVGFRLTVACGNWSVAVISIEEVNVQV